VGSHDPPLLLLVELDELVLVEPVLVELDELVPLELEELVLVELDEPPPLPPAPPPPDDELVLVLVDVPVLPVLVDEEVLSEDELSAACEHPAVAAVRVMRSGSPG
jgi:hypothetical protein